MSLWRVWVAMQRSGTPAGAAVVACPARRECAVIREPSSPAAPAWMWSRRATTCPDSGVRLTEMAQIRVNSGPGASPRGPPGGHGCDGIGAGVLAVGDGPVARRRAGRSWSVTRSTADRRVCVRCRPVSGRPSHRAATRRRAEQDDRGVAGANGVVRSTRATIRRISSRVSGRARCDVQEG